MNARPPLDEVRRELQRLGYLSHRVQRFLLRDALAPRWQWTHLARLALRVGLIVGALLAAANAAPLALANGLAGSPADLALLYLHLLVPTVAGSALGFLLLLAVFRGLLAAFPRRGLGWARLAAAAGTALAILGCGVWLGWEFLVGLPRGGRVAAAAALPLVAGGVAKWVADGLLAFGIHVTRSAPSARIVSRRWVAGAALVSALALAAVALAGGAAGPSPGDVPLPMARGERVALVGVDGVPPPELDFRLAQGALPGFAALLRQGGVLARYRRDAAASPAEFWTSVATGRAATDHGVVALDGFRPAGMAATLGRVGPWRFYFGSVATALGVAEQRPLLAGRRRVPTFWELAARGGRPVAAIDWWSTYPAAALSGLVVAHGAFERLAAGDPGAVAPPVRLADVGRLRAEVAAEAEAETGDRRGAEARLADRFHRRVAAREFASGAVAVAVYLPALDLLADRSPEPAHAVSEELAAADRLVAEWSAEAATLVVVFDPGRGGGREGRALIWNRRCAAESPPALDPRQLASALLRAAGLPQSRELPPPPEFCAWPEPPLEVASYGPHASPGGAAGDEGEYLETLRALGYL